MILSQGRLAEALRRLQLQTAKSGNVLGNLMPTHGQVMWTVVQDIFSLGPVKDVVTRHLDELFLALEFQTITIDCTVKVALATMGQTGKAQLAWDHSAGAFSEQDHRRRVLTVRGRTGAVLLMTSVREESIDDMTKVLVYQWPQKYLHQVEFLGSDSPSRAMLCKFRQVCLNITCLYLDTVHVAMRYETAFARKSSAGSSELRRVMKKFTAPPISNLADAPWMEGPYWGLGAEPLSTSELRLQKTIRGHRVHSYITLQEAETYLENLDIETPFTTLEGFLKAIACLFVVQRRELAKTGRLRVSLANMLANFVEPGNCGWLFNNQYRRASIPEHQRSLLATGTTGNEALHAELKLAFRQTIRLHQSTLVTKLHIFGVGKLIAHVASLTRPTSRQMRFMDILARSLAVDVLPPTAWQSVCGRARPSGVLHKAVSDLQWWRAVNVAKVKQWLAKRPSTKKRSARRTVFTQRHLRTEY